MIYYRDILRSIFDEINIRSIPNSRNMHSYFDTRKPITTFFDKLEMMTFQSHMQTFRDEDELKHPLGVNRIIAWCFRLTNDYHYKISHSYSNDTNDIEEFIDIVEEVLKDYDFYFPEGMRTYLKKRFIVKKTLKYIIYNDTYEKIEVFVLIKQNSGLTMLDYLHHLADYNENDIFLKYQMIVELFTHLLNEELINAVFTANRNGGTYLDKVFQKAISIANCGTPIAIVNASDIKHHNNIIRFIKELFLNDLKVLNTIYRFYNEVLSDETITVKSKEHFTEQVVLNPLSIGGFVEDNNTFQFIINLNKLDRIIVDDLKKFKSYLKKYTPEDIEIIEGSSKNDILNFKGYICKKGAKIKDVGKYPMQLEVLLVLHDLIEYFNETQFIYSQIMRDYPEDFI